MHVVVTALAAVLWCATCGRLRRRAAGGMRERSAPHLHGSSGFHDPARCQSVRVWLRGSGCNVTKAPLLRNWANPRAIDNGDRQARETGCAVRDSRGRAVTLSGIPGAARTRPRLFPGSGFYDSETAGMLKNSMFGWCSAPPPSVCDIDPNCLQSDPAPWYQIDVTPGVSVAGRFDECRNGLISGKHLPVSRRWGVIAESIAKSVVSCAIELRQQSSTTQWRARGGVGGGGRRCRGAHNPLHRYRCRTTKRIQLFALGLAQLCKLQSGVCDK